jgi:hypothetical protein
MVISVAHQAGVVVITAGPTRTVVPWRMRSRRQTAGDSPPRPLRAALHHSRLDPPPCPQSSMSSQYPRPPAISRLPRRVQSERATCANCITHARMLPMLCCSLVFWLRRRLVQWEAVCLTLGCLTYSSRAALARGFTSGRLVAVTSHWQTSAASQAHHPSTQLRCIFATAP